MSMAESSKEPVVPEVPENEDFTLLVEDLVNYVMIQRDPLYSFEIDTTRNEEFTDNAFNLPIRSAIECLFHTSGTKSDEDNIFRDIHRNEIVSSTNYTTFANSLVSQHFTDGFDARYFLSFCIRISKMAAIYYRHGVEDAPMLAKSYIINILKEHNVTVDVWNNLHSNAREFGQHLEKGIWLSENIDSEEVELNRAQDEVSGHESKDFSLSAKQNVSAENEENLVEQQERACSRNEIYIKNSAYYSSESSADAGILKEQEPSSEYLPPTFNSDENRRISSSETSGNARPASSNVDQESVDNDSISQRIIDMSSKELNESIDKSVSDDSCISGSSRANQKSKILDKSDRKRKVDLILNETDKEKSVMTLKGNVLKDSVLPMDEFSVETSSTCQKESFASKESSKMEVELPSDEESSSNCP